MITFLLTPGQESDIDQAEKLMETGTIRRLQVRCVCDLTVWWQIKAIPVLPYEPISPVTIFVAPSLGAATSDAEVCSTHNTIERGISLKDSSIVSSNFVASPLATKNGLPISLP